MEYARFAYTSADLGGENKLKLHPIVCWHLGAKQCDLRWIQSQIKEIKEDPAARWIYLGDGGECVTKLSKGHVYEQTLSIQEQMDGLVELLDPIKHKGLFGIRGNHGNRVDKEVGMSFDKSLMQRLGRHYLDISCIVNIKVNRSSYNVFCHHGVDSGVSLQAKFNSSQKWQDIVVDLKLTAHSHIAQPLHPYVYRMADNHTNTIRSMWCHQAICGSAYDSRVSGYAEDKAYNALIPGRIIATLDGRVQNGYPVQEVELQAKYRTKHYNTKEMTEELLIDLKRRMRERELEERLRVDF